MVVLDPQGRFVIPLLGGHQAGGEALSQQVAAVLGAEVVSTGSSSGRQRLALDSSSAGPGAGGGAAAATGRA